MIRWLPLLGLLACQTGPIDIPIPEPKLTVFSPTYAEFAGDSPTIRVEGEVNDPHATVWVEGREANVGSDGSFAVDLPVPGPYRIVDVEAANPKGHLRERIPVFSGHDPLETWPGALGARVTPLGLEALGNALEPTFAQLDLAGLLYNALPSISTSGFAFEPLGYESGVVDVTLLPAVQGLDMTIGIHGTEISAAYDIPILGADTLTIGIDEIVIGVEVQPEVDASGMLWLAFGDSTLTLSDPTLETGTLDPVILEDLLGGALAGLGPLASGALDGLLQGMGALPLGGPFEFSLDLLGTPMTIGIDELYGDLDGLGLVLGLDLGGQGNGAGVAAPDPGRAHWASHAVLSIHEGLFQLLLDSDLLDMFSQDIELGGMLGGVLEIPIKALPGGSGAPVDATGWCLAINPGDARVARLNPDAEQLATLYFPDFQFDVGVQKGGSTTCWPWLDASVAMEIGLGLQPDGNIDLAIDIGDGAVLNYETPAEWDEQGVVDGLGSLLDLALGFLGGSALNFNIGDLLGGGAGGLPIGELEILEVRPVVDAEGEPIEGLMDLSVRIF